MIQQELPKWLQETQSYEPQQDKNPFLKKTQEGLIHLLGKIKMQSMVDGRKSPSPAIALFVLFEVVLCTVLSNNLTYVFVELCILIVYLATFPAKIIPNILLEMLSGIVFAFIFSLPVYVMGNTNTMYIFVLKTAVTVGSVALFTHKIPFYQLNRSFKKNFVSDHVKFIFDITIKYLVVLGRICMQMTDALTLRSIGRNRKKQSTAAGILGVTYLKSQTMSKEMYQAMVCRGFDGTYKIYQKHRFVLADALLILAGVIFLVIFVFFQIL